MLATLRRAYARLTGRRVWVDAQGRVSLIDVVLTDLGGERWDKAERFLGLGLSQGPSPVLEAGYVDGSTYALRFIRPDGASDLLLPPSSE